MYEKKREEERGSLRYSGEVSAEELRAAEEYLSSYRHGAKMLDCMRYGKQFMGSEFLPEDPLLQWSETYDDLEYAKPDADESIIRARMNGVRQFVSELKPSRATPYILALMIDSSASIIRARMNGVRQFVSELKCDSNTRLLLYWHYIRGVSVTRCAEMMDISRAGAFRVRKRALETAARALRKMKNSANILDLLPL